MASRHLKDPNLKILEKNKQLLNMSMIIPLFYMSLNTFLTLPFSFVIKFDQGYKLRLNCKCKLAQGEKGKGESQREASKNKSSCGKIDFFPPPLALRP